MEKRKGPGFTHESRSLILFSLRWRRLNATTPVGWLATLPDSPTERFPALPRMLQPTLVGAQIHLICARAASRTKTSDATSDLLFYMLSSQHYPKNLSQ